MNETLRQAVLELMNQHGIGALEYEGPEGNFALDTERMIQDHPDILAEAPGQFLWMHPAETERPTWPRQVKQGEIVGWLKVGPLLKPVVASTAGILQRPHMEHGSLAGYGERLL